MSVFRCTPKICTGPDALEQLRQIRANRVLLVTDQFFSENGTAVKIAGMVPGAETTIFDKVIPDPSAGLAAEGAALCTAVKPEVLLALGGGSVIDCAKGIRAAYDGELIFVAIPTTSGSGSEMTSYTILTKDGVKYPLVDERLRPDLTILEERLLEGLPPRLIADTGMDLLAHCMEALVGSRRNGFTDALAIYGVQTVFKLLIPSFQGDTSVRMGIHEAASMAGLAFDHAGLGLCHAMAHSMGGLFHIPHGRLCAMLLPHVITCNAAVSLGQYAELARRCGLSGVTDRLALRSLLAELHRLRTALRLPETLSQAGVGKAQLEEHRTAVISAALSDPCCKTNPIPVTEDVVAGILKAVAS